MNLSDNNCIQQILNEAFSAQQTQYRKKIDAQWRVLRGDLLEFVLGALKNTYPKTWESFTATDINLAKKITHKRSQAYKKQPLRLLESDKETEDYQELLTSMEATKVLRTHDAYYNYFKYSCVWFNYYTDEDGKQKTIMRALRPNQFMRKVNSKGQTTMFLVFFGETESSAVNLNGDGKKGLFQDEPEDNKSHKIGIWTKDQHVLVNARVVNGICDFDREEIEGNPNGINPLGMIPAMFSQEGDEYDRPPVSNLGGQTVVINQMLSTIITGMNAQAFGQLIVKYPETQPFPDIIQQGMMTFLKLPQVGADQPATEADYISPTPDLANALNVFYSFVSAVLDEHQITVSSIKGDIQTFSSGLDRMLAHADTNEVIEANQEIYAGLEKRLYQLVKKFKETKGEFLFKTEKLMVKYVKPNPMMSEKEILENAKVKLDMGIIEKHEVLQALDPNMDSEKAKEKVSQIEALSKESVNEVIGRFNNADKQE